MLKQQLSCPVAVSADRCEAARYLSRKYDLDVVISDDGLQHYKLPRDYEIVIVDGEREFGNTRYLPAGPLREPISRLNKSDIVVSNGENSAYEYQYTAQCSAAVSLPNNSVVKAIEEFKNSRVHAVAGIGNPKRYFAMLEKIGLSIIPHSFPDHHVYTRSDIDFNDELSVLMTEKDAVKCRRFNKENAWYLPIVAVPNGKLEERISNLLEEIS